VRENGWLVGRFRTGEYLRKSWVFAELEPEQLSKLARQFTFAAFGQGDTIIEEGVTDDRCVVVLRGALLVTYVTVEGMEKTVLELPGATINAEGALGLRSMLKQCARMINAE
jgi:signal-transduction protein with cAMP-binding, CBS, and nucleotidyltransferase domain